MFKLLVTLALCAHLLAPMSVHATASVRSPLSVSLAEYGLMFGAAIFGGVVSWYRKVRRGEIPAWGLGYLIGEMTMAAFSGLLTFWAAESAGAPQFITAALCGVSGLASAKLLTLAELAAQRFAEKRLGLKSGDKA